MKVALLCDVDQAVYHVGDEAIASMSAARLIRRGHEVVRISRHEKYGPGGVAPAASIPALTFPWPLEDRARYLAEIRRVLAGESGALPADDKLFGIIEQLRRTDALVIGGGGSLTSRFGWLLDERLATALVARSLDLPVVLTGQSLGPELTPADRKSVRELLELCALVGLRDAHSVRLARDLCPGHAALVQTLDDALGLGLPAAEDPAENVQLDSELLSVTLGGDGDPLPRGEYIAVAAAVVDTLAERTGARVELVPHMADPDNGGGDLALHEEVARALRVPAQVLPIELDRTSAARTAGAGWVLSTRFHPVVFGSAAGSAVLALPLNRYGASRMDGALRNVGLTGGAVPFAALWDPITGGASPLVNQIVDALVNGREEEYAHLELARMRLLLAADSWWDRISEVVQTGSAPTGLEDPVGAGIAPRERWGGTLREHLRPWTREVAPPKMPHSAPVAPAAALIMRTRDRALMLDRAVQDVLAQTRQDWELVIVDDAGDQQAVREVVDRHAAEADGRIRVLRRETSTGMEAASNYGLRETTAPMIAIHDDDDTWHASFLQETLAHLDAHPEHEAVVVRTLIVHEHETATGFVEDEVFLSWPELEGVRLVDYIAVNRNVPIAMAHRRRVHDVVGQYDESLPVVGDYAFHLALLQRAKVGFRDRPLAQWRQRPSAVGTGRNSMYALADAHRHYDAELRERFFREWSEQHGIGLPMFLSKNTETHVQRSEERLLGELRAMREEIGALHERLDRTESDSAQRGLGSLGVRAARRALRAGRRFTFMPGRPDASSHQ
ncbi:glycosyltransferase [Brachybacterium paraconglomeratum]|uniref:glycosyltransferase n=1 Tax=Brachybacterium paraconglomeratum TaxID=173362 RepID=UPI0022B0126F|nr:glycosyltransferase [Brachybacterium paraconglomeratum]MCZ4326172.1 glycosyltransferase [Brachybacterium paraconglomeratum]